MEIKPKLTLKQTKTDDINEEATIRHYTLDPKSNTELYNKYGEHINELVEQHNLSDECYYVDVDRCGDIIIVAQPGVYEHPQTSKKYCREALNEFIDELKCMVTC